MGEPVWLPHNRPADSMECRKKYLETLEKGFSAPAIEIWCCLSPQPPFRQEKNAFLIKILYHETV